MLQRDEPQEMRDLFAAAALFGIVKSDTWDTLTARKVWNLSDLMMEERRNRIEARKVVRL